VADGRTKQRRSLATRGFDGALRTLDVGLHVLRRLERKQAVVQVAMTADGVASLVDLAHHVGVEVHLATHDEERGAMPARRQDSQHAARRHRVRPVIERQRDAALAAPEHVPVQLELRK
jgi:hypothetical protein